ncbi:hypothetical protein NFJ02_11g05320 [Pycnococcus provasolii]
MLLAANIRSVWGKLLRSENQGAADLMTSDGVFATLQPLEMPVCNVLACNVLAEMEYRGILVDTAEMRRQLSDLDEKKRELLSSIRQLVPFRRVTENTLTVPRDLSTFLFHGEMGLGLEATGIPLTKTGRCPSATCLLATCLLRWSTAAFSWTRLRCAGSCPISTRRNASCSRRYGSSFPFAG